MYYQMPVFTTDNNDINRAFRFALADIYCNIHPYKAGLIDNEQVLCAGFDYLDPWTRDTAINIYNGAPLLFPEIARNNLLSTITWQDGNLVLRNAIGAPEGDNNYWDAVIWVIGAWYYYVYTGDTSLMQTAMTVARNTFDAFEVSEYDEETGLFRGAAVYGDGIAAYPDSYQEPGWKYADIGGWPRRNPDRKYHKGSGLPMYSLSTNCVYVKAYKLAAQIAQMQGDEISSEWKIKADRLKDAINKAFWMEDKGTYRYLIDPYGGSDYQEGLGISYAILFGIADERQTARILENAYITPNGIACVWPTYPRYRRDGNSFGRHSGTIWPFVQAFWAEAALKGGRPDLFNKEFLTLTRMAVNSDGFYEIYHPISGEPYGGLQEGAETWASVPRQTWSATGYLRMILTGIIGIRFEKDGISFKPSLPESISSVRLKDLRFRDMIFDISISGSGNNILSIMINGKPENFVSYDTDGTQIIQITLGDQSDYSDRG